jgi:superfamily II DNA or RNA helicase
MRMKTLMSLPSKEKYATQLMNNSNHKCIVFANTKEQADKLCRYSYHSGNKKSEENLQNFKDGVINRLSCVLQLNEGINIPNLKEGIILHSYSNERKSNQRIGRLLRLNPDDKSIIHILCYSNTIDETWVKEALSDLDQNKITWKNINQLELDL